MKKIKSYLMSLIVIMVITVTLIPQISSAAYLSVGSRGGDVADLQSWLIENGFPIPFIENGLATPGYFGEQTRDAVKMYQESKGVRTTGSINSDFIFDDEAKLGGFPGADFLVPTINNNGIRQTYESRGMTPYASTTCNYKITATSTLVHFSGSFNQLASSTAVEIGYASAPNATTTSLGIATLPTAGGVIVASTTAAWQLYLIPNQWLAIKVGEAGLSGSTPKIAGSCKIITREITNMN